jgi:hypothetical protein
MCSVGLTAGFASGADSAFNTNTVRIEDIVGPSGGWGGGLGAGFFEACLKNGGQHFLLLFEKGPPVAQAHVPELDQMHP